MANDVTEAAKLLRDMEKEAKRQVLAAFAPAGENHVDGTVVITTAPERMFDVAVLVRFTLNGEKYESVEYISCADFDTSRADVAAVHLRKTLAAAVAKVLTLKMVIGK